MVACDITGAEEDTVATLGDGALARRTDVTSPAEIEATVAAAVSEFGGLDVLANVAGIDGELVPIEPAAKRTSIACWRSTCAASSSG